MEVFTQKFQINDVDYPTLCQRCPNITVPTLLTTLLAYSVPTLLTVIVIN